ncbi:MAG TPA: hypothetical protein VFS43_38135 [Polyangiaceae bacterium]|nr:hypothetical protein [Polyangiaceae bacterium]
MSRAAGERRAGGDGLAWTRAQRKRLRGPLHPHPLDPPGRPPSGEACWQALVERYRGEAPWRQRGNEGPTEAIRASDARVRASLEAGEAPGELAAGDEFVRAAIALYDHLNGAPPPDGRVERALVGFWVGAAGLPFAIEMLAGEAGFATSGVYSPMTYFRLDLLAPTANAGAFRVQSEIFWCALRAHVVALPEGDARYAAALEAAEAAWARGGDATRVGCALAFPREPRWAAEVATDALARPARGDFWWASKRCCVLASLADLAIADEFTAALAQPPGSWAHLVADYALDLVDVLGARAAGPLATVLASAGLAPARRALAAALVLASPESARATAARLAAGPAHAALTAALAK